MTDKILSLLGLSRRANRLVYGFDPVQKAIIEKKARLILTASDFSHNSEKKIRAFAEERNITILSLPYDKEALSRSVGHHCGVVAVTDDGFSDKLQQLITTANDEI